MGYDEKTRQYILDNLIFLTVAGSHAYGLATETSDMDIRGIFIADKTYVIGDNRIEHYQNSTNDTVIYELKFVLHLIADQNPNVVELLNVDEEDIIYATEEYWNIRKHRDELLSSLCKFRFSGYAISQLKRIKGHNRWLAKEQEGKFGKPDRHPYWKLKKHVGHKERYARRNKLHRYFESSGRKSFKRYTDEELLEFIKMNKVDKEGNYPIPDRDIAKHFGTSIPSVQYLRRKLNCSLTILKKGDKTYTEKMILNLIKDSEHVLRRRSKI